MVTILPVVSPDVLSNSAIFKEIVAHGACLISFSHYAKDSTKALNIYKALADEGVRVVLDSGAYEVHTSNGKLHISKEEYADFLLQYAVDDPIKGKKSLFETYINLDVIYKAKESRDNLNYLRDKGLFPMPVFHFQKSIAKRDEHYWDEFYFCLNNPDAHGVVGLGGAVPQHRLSLQDWYDELGLRVKRHPYAKIKGGQVPIRFHALGVASSYLLKKFKEFFYYADASTWTWGDAAYGLVHVFDPDLQRTYELKAREIHQQTRDVRDIINGQCKQLGLNCKTHRTNECILCEMKYGGCA